MAEIIDTNVGTDQLCSRKISKFQLPDKRCQNLLSNRTEHKCYYTGKNNTETLLYKVFCPVTENKKHPMFYDSEDYDLSYSLNYIVCSPEYLERAQEDLINYHVRYGMYPQIGSRLREYLRNV